MENMWWSSSGFGFGFGNGLLYTVCVIIILFIFQFIIIPIFRRSSTPIHHHSSNRVSSSEEEEEDDVITDLDLQLLIHDLNDDLNHEWSPVVDKSNHSLSYSVKSFKPKHGAPLKYLSTTTFNSCSSDLLRDFYMDNIYRKEWDKTLIHHHQLHINHSNGTEFGRTIKKFPLLTPREYILAWKLWETHDQTTYYCFTKECNHPLAPTQNKYVRVSLFRSGWRIRQVGTNSCQIKMLHQEDAGLNVDMAKLIFAKGIWSYVCKMDNALRKYTDIKRLQLNSTITAITLVQKVPLSLDSTSKIGDIPHHPIEQDYSEKKVKVSRKPSKKLIANGLILVGGIICLTRGHTNFTAKVAMAYALSKLKKPCPQNKQTCLQ